MAKTSMNIRMNSDVKEQAQRLFSELGMDMTTAVNLFLRQSIREQGIPFELRADPFYSVDNQLHLKKAISELEAEKGKVHELLEVEDE